MINDPTVFFLIKSPVWVPVLRKHSFLFLLEHNYILPFYILTIDFFWGVSGWVGEWTLPTIMPLIPKYMFCFSYWFYLYYFSQRPAGVGCVRTDPRYVNDKMATSHNFQVNRIPDITAK